MTFNKPTLYSDHMLMEIIGNPTHPEDVIGLVILNALGAAIQRGEP